MFKTPSRKRPESPICPLHAKKKRKIMSYNSNKENCQNFLNFESNRKNNTEYLYADPSFIRDAKFTPAHKRLDGGDVSEKDIFYDCYPCDYDANPKDMMHKQLQIFEVINEIQNPKEFKNLLKQMAFTSNMLYRTFRQAYSKTKKNKYSAQGNKVYDKPLNNSFKNDMGPLEIINIEVPAVKREFVEDVRYRTWGKDKNKKKKSFKKGKCPNDNEECFCYVCSNCQELNKEGTREDELLDCKNFEEIPNDSECDFKKEFKWYPQDSCLKQTNVCDNIEDDLKDLNFCDRCRVLRAETPWPNRIENENFTQPQTHQKITNCKTETCCQAPNDCMPCSQIPKQILSLNPVCLTIPLKLQIDSENCQSRFIETEIIMETCGGSGIQTQKTCHLTPNPDISNCSKTNQNNTIKPRDKFGYLPGSELFYSCISNSDIIKKTESQKTCGDSSLTEVLDIIKKRMPHTEEMSKTYQIATTKQLEDKGIQLSMPSPAATLQVSKDLYSKTDFTQIEQKPTIISKSKGTSSTLPASYILDPKDKAKKLRADLLEEVRLALEQTTPQAALKALLEGKRFSLPSNLRPKETPTIAPVRYSFPSNYQNITPSPKTLQPLKSLPPPPPISSSKPLIPPKPLLVPKPPEFITETVQTDASAIKASGHYKRNEMRSEIQEELKELLQPNAVRNQNKYKPEERDEILLDLYKLFHPQKAGCLPKQISKENALQDINYLIKPQSTSSTIGTAESQESIIECVKHILNPKAQTSKSKRKKYTKETKDKILEDLQIILKRHDKKVDTNHEIRNSVLYDLRFMLDTGQETTSPQRPPRPSQLEQTPVADIHGPSSSKAQQIREQRQQKAPNEMRDSLIADLRYMLDTQHPPPQASPPIPPKPKKIHSTNSSEISLLDQERTTKQHKVQLNNKSSTNNKYLKILDSHQMEESSSSETFFMEMHNK